MVACVFLSSVALWLADGRAPGCGWLPVLVMRPGAGLPGAGLPGSSRSSPMLVISIGSMWLPSPDR